MAIKQDLKQVANAIRSKTGKNNLMTVGEMPEEIESIETGVTPTGNINITTTQPTDVTNYATATVVDSNLVAANIKKDVTILGIIGTSEGYPEPSGTKTINANGIVDVKDYASADVNVPRFTGTQQYKLNMDAESPTYATYISLPNIPTNYNQIAVEKVAYNFGEFLWDIQSETVTLGLSILECFPNVFGRRLSEDSRMPDFGFITHDFTPSGPRFTLSSTIPYTLDYTSRDLTKNSEYMAYLFQPSGYDYYYCLPIWYRNLPKNIIFTLPVKLPASHSYWQDHDAAAAVSDVLSVITSNISINLVCLFDPSEQLSVSWQQLVSYHDSDLEYIEWNVGTGTIRFNFEFIEEGSGSGSGSGSGMGY